MKARLPLGGGMLVAGELMWNLLPLYKSRHYHAGEGAGVWMEVIGEESSLIILIISKAMLGMQVHFL